MKKINYYFSKILGSGKYPLDSIGNFNPSLKIVSYDNKEQNLSAFKSIWEKIVEKYGNDNNKLREVNSETRFILPKNKQTGKLLKLLGYKEISPAKLN